MTTRSRKLNDAPGLADLEGAASPAEAPGIMPPPGVEANVETKVRYTRTIVDPEKYYSDDLRELAAEEDNTAPLPEAPPDPLTEFCHTWRNFVGYSLRIVRLPDPANKRMPGQSYANTCLELTALGAVPFEPNNIVSTLQMVNGNSGGAFRLFLADENGTPIPGARLDRILIPDPPKAYDDPRRFNPNGYNHFGEDRYFRYERERERQLPPAPPPKSETELYIEQMQRELFTKMVTRALDPPAPPVVDPLATLPMDTRLALGLLEKGDLLSNVVERITNLAQSPERIESATWKDKLADAGVNLVTQNPAIITTVTDILSRMVLALASAFAPRSQQSQLVNEPIPVQHTSTQRIPPPPLSTQRAPAPSISPQLPYSGGHIEQIPGLPETPQTEDEIGDEQDAEIDMVEDVVKLLLSEKPLRLDDPVILDIQEAYPKIFAQVMTAIVTLPSATLIQYVCGQSDFCADLFNSERNGPYLRERLEQFKVLLNQAATQSNATTAQTTETAPANDPA